MVLILWRTEQCFPGVKASRAIAREYIKHCWHEKPYNLELGDRKLLQKMSVFKCYSETYIKSVSEKEGGREKRPSLLEQRVFIGKQYLTRF